jgi:hypothetical protein
MKKKCFLLAKNIGPRALFRTFQNPDASDFELPQV